MTSDNDNIHTDVMCLRVCGYGDWRLNSIRNHSLNAFDVIFVWLFHSRCDAM